MIQVNIISYGYAHLVAQAIESVLSQTKKPERILVVDDGKHDGVENIAKRYPVEVLIREKNLGIVDNFQDVLMNHTFSDKVMFLGADNWLRPDALEKMDTGTDIISSDIALFGEDTDKFRNGLKTEYKDGFYIWRFEKGNIETGNYIHGSSLYDVKKAKEAGGYKRNEQSKNTEEDWMLFREMMRREAVHSHVPEPLLFYRRHKENFNA